MKVLLYAVLKDQVPHDERTYRILTSDTNADRRSLKTEQYNSRTENGSNISQCADDAEKHRAERPQPALA